MANHQVSMKIAEQAIKSKDVTFDVRIKSDSGSQRKIGELLISQGSVEWRKSCNSVHRKYINWEKFAELMEEHGKIRRGKK